MRTSIAHQEQVNLLGAWCLSPGQRRIRLHVQSGRGLWTGVQVVAFLRRLLRPMRGPLVLVWDKHGMHKRKLVSHFLEEHPRVDVNWFPTAAPELNPVEFVWTQVSEATASTAPHNRSELYGHVHRGVERTRRSQSRLWACLHASDLPWKRALLHHAH